jgi:hypothetical protein
LFSFLGWVHPRDHFLCGYCHHHVYMFLQSKLQHDRQLIRAVQRDFCDEGNRIH